MIDTYYFNSQLSRYIIQFMNIFGGMTVMTGKREDGEIKEILVPIQYGSRDRVTASILGQNTQNKPLRLPVMSCYMQSIAYADQRKKGVGTVRNTTYVPQGGLLPDDARVVKQLMPNPYDVTMSLSVYTSNINTQHQILEQIFMLFDPILQIQTSDSMLDWTKITQATLRDINYEENYPAGTDRRMIVTTMSFEVPIYISAPANLKNEIVRKIYARIGVVDTDIALNKTNSSDILSQLDDQLVNYELLASSDDIDVI